MVKFYLLKQNYEGGVKITKNLRLASSYISVAIGFGFS